jgi:hypothetical protein
MLPPRSIKGSSQETENKERWFKSSHQPPCKAEKPLWKRFSEIFFTFKQVSTTQILDIIAAQSLQSLTDLKIRRFSFFLSIPCQGGLSINQWIAADSGTATFTQCARSNPTLYSLCSIAWLSIKREFGIREGRADKLKVLNPQPIGSPYA